jgi:hypothetical protein
MNTCFDGMGYTHCDVIGEQPELANMNVDSPLNVGGGKPFCLECCSNSRTDFFFKETWNLQCPVAPQPEIDTNVYEHVFRFMRRRTLDDKKFVECLIPRKPEVQRIITTPIEVDGVLQNISGSFSLQFDRFNSTPVHFNAVGQTWEEMRLRNDAGTGFEESMEMKLKNIMLAYERNSTDPPEFQEETRKFLNGYIQVPRSQVVDASSTDGDGNVYAWTEEQLAELVTVENFNPNQLRISRHGPYDKGGYTWSITFPDNIYNVPRLTSEILDLVGDVTIEPVNPNPDDPANSLFLHGYHVQLEVTENVHGAEVWKGVEYCKVNTTERPGPPEMFYQSMTVMKSGGSAVRPSAIIGLLCLLMVALVSTVL